MSIIVQNQSKLMALLSLVSAFCLPANASEVDAQLSEIEALGNNQAQINNVFQLSDVSPDDWAFEALRNLAQRYGCIAGYPDGTYQGNQPISRYEFAAGLNACLQKIEQLISQGNEIDDDDLATLERLIANFEAELSVLGNRIDNLEGRVGFLEDNQFSTTTKLVGEVAFTLANVFGDDIDENNTVFTERIRLQFVTSFTGKDKLLIRMTGGNIGNSFQDETGTREGRFAFDGQSGNDLFINRLHYVFPVGEKATVTLMPVLGAHHFYADVFNSGLNAGGGAAGALSRFGERSPIYRLGIGVNTTGAGFRYKLSDAVEISAGYLAPNGREAEEGLFGGRFSALGQLVFSPSDRFRAGLTYVRGHDTSDRPGALLWGGTGTNLANLRGVVPTVPVNSDTFGAQFEWNASSKVSLRGWFSYSDLTFIEGGAGGSDGDGEVLSYAGVVAFPDLFKEGNFGALIVGAEPYLTDLSVEGDPSFSEDVPIHLEALYKHRLNDNILLTPGVIWILSPNQDEDNDDIVIGALRMTFQF